MLDAILLLCFLFSQVNGLITTDAKCQSGFDWTFSSIGQSPCDVAAELASVCVGGDFNLDPLDPGFVYAGPTQTNQNSCRCSSVYYSLLSACAYCQGRSYVRWSVYSGNCSTVYVATYNQQIPDGVKVQAYAYLNVLDSDSFNVANAQGLHGTESSRLPSSVPSPSASARSSSSKNTPAIIGGVVGGVAFLGILSVLIAYLIIRSRRKKNRKSQQNQISGFQQSSKTGFTPNTTGPAKLYDPDDPSTYPTADPNLYDPYRQQSPPVNQNVTPMYTGNSARNSLPPQAVTQSTTGGRSHHTGTPEL